MKRRFVLASFYVFVVCALCLSLMPGLSIAEDGTTAAPTTPTEEVSTVQATDASISEETQLSQVATDVVDQDNQESTETTQVSEAPTLEVGKQATDASVTTGTEVQATEGIRQAEEQAVIGEATEPEAATSESTGVVTALLANVTSPTVTYHTHVQTYGWQDWVVNGAQAGTSGESKRLEGIEIGVRVPGISGGIRYKTHVQTYGWQDWVYDGNMSGTSGESKRLEGIQIELTGDLANHYDVWYRVHCQTYGWLGWVHNGEMAGTSGESKRLEAIEVKLMRKGTTTVVPQAGALVNYNVHCQTYGWLATEVDGAQAGTTGEAKRLEGINIQLGSQVIGGIEYRTHVQTYGWQDWVANGAMSGTSGESKRLEGIQIRLTGEAADKYDVWYRTHVQTYGWQGWARNGGVSGTTGQSKRLESIQIMLLEKGSTPPGATASLIYIDAGHGKSGSVGYDSGAVGSGYVEADLTKELVNNIVAYARNNYGLNVYPNIDCDKHYTERQAHAKSVGATALLSIHFNSASAGATGIESYIYRAYDQYNGAAATGSDTLQEIMHRHLHAALPNLVDRGLRSDAFAVVNGKSTGIPATLLEVCFISNSSDMAYYQARKDDVARELAAGLYEAYMQGF